MTQKAGSLAEPFLEMPLPYLHHRNFCAPILGHDMASGDRFSLISAVPADWNEDLWGLFDLPPGTDTTRLSSQSFPGGNPACIDTRIEPALFKHAGIHIFPREHSSLGGGDRFRRVLGELRALRPSFACDNEQDAYEFWARLRTDRDISLYPHDTGVRLVVAYIDLFIPYLAPRYTEFDALPPEFVSAAQLRCIMAQVAAFAFAPAHTATAAAVAPLRYDDMVIYALAKMMRLPGGCALAQRGALDLETPFTKIHGDSVRRAVEEGGAGDDHVSAVYAQEQRAMDAGMLALKGATLAAVEARLRLLTAQDAMPLVVELCTTHLALTHNGAFYWHLLRRLRDRAGLPRLHDRVVTPHHLARARAVVVS